MHTLQLRIHCSYVGDLVYNCWFLSLSHRVSQGLVIIFIWKSVWQCRFPNFPETRETWQRHEGSSWRANESQIGNSAEGNIWVNILPLILHGRRNRSGWSGHCRTNFSRSIGLGTSRTVVWVRNQRRRAAQVRLLVIDTCTCTMYSGFQLRWKIRKLRCVRALRAACLWYYSITYVRAGTQWRNCSTQRSFRIFQRNWNPLYVHPLGFA